ncbi:hypothetical protein, partial [Marinicauda pacifica]
IIVAPSIGFGVHFWRDGAEAISSEAYIWALYGLLPLGILLVSIFSWNLAAAPYRIERDRRVRAEAALPRDFKKDATFRHRKRYTLRQVAVLMAEDERTEKIILHDLKQNIQNADLKPSFRNLNEQFQIRMIRSAAFSDDADDIPDTLEIEREELQRFLPKAGYNLPPWLQDSPERIPQ